MKSFRFESLTLNECNTLLKLVHPDVNPKKEATELTLILIVARKRIKDSTGICLHCGQEFKKRKARIGYKGTFCSTQCNSRFRQCRNKNLPMVYNGRESSM
jgi:predicted transcriptional regulator